MHKQLKKRRGKTDKMAKHIFEIASLNKNKLI